MTPSISKKTLAYLNELDASEPSIASDPIVYYGRLDQKDKQIYSEGLRIKKLVIDKELDVLVLLLSNGQLLKKKLSSYFGLNADEQQLSVFENEGTGIYWPELDMDLSLRGFLDVDSSNESAA